MTDRTTTHPGDGDGDGSGAAGPPDTAALVAVLNQRLGYFRISPHQVTATGCAEGAPLIILPPLSREGAALLSAALSLAAQRVGVSRRLLDALAAHPLDDEEGDGRESGA
ncbi:hypothetical protein [Streptomyces aidingensis]|uniref:Uncharacterized protein n=1 Tax=Streptomyces aidingensis TaxID=910347 RepID=A0A1I1TME7_9ACTN|nr:hypothetical protein [Streptomyces aidingensis]SFD59679.1 hypothetical protein SAMN05421773_12040 [Streptomyces aidingensis]